MVSFWINPHILNYLHLNCQNSEKDSPVTIENVIQLSLELHKLNIQFLELDDWLKFTSESTPFPEEEAILCYNLVNSYLKTYSLNFDYRYMILFLLIQTYHPCSLSLTKENVSFFKTYDRIYDASISSLSSNKMDDYVFELQYNTMLINETSYFFDNLLVVFVCLFFTNPHDENLDVIIDNVVNGNYSYFIPSFQITPSSLSILSHLFSCGNELGEDELITTIIPSSYIDSFTSFYNPFDLIIFIENHMACLTLQSILQHNLSHFHYTPLLTQQEIHITEDASLQHSYFIHCMNCHIDISCSLHSLLIEDCSSCTIQCGIIDGILILRRCQNITISSCCKQLLVIDCEGILSYLYSPMNPLYINTPSSEVVTAPYNIPRKDLLKQLEDVQLVGRNCWNMGIDIHGNYYPCAVLPPSLFTPFLSHAVGIGNEKESLQLPLLPEAYEDVFIQVFNSL